MPRFAIVLEGKNFPIVTDTGVQVLGFYTTRKLKAETEQQAVLMALEQVKTDPQLLAVIDRDKTSSPRLFMKSAHTLAWWEDMKSSGYTFFPMQT